MDKLIFGLKVKTLREHRKLTQSKLAEMINIADNTISNIETGKNHPHINTIIAISEALDVSLNFLVADNNDITKICMDEIEKCMFMFDEDIANHVMEHIEMCLELDEKIKKLKKCENIEFSWFKGKYL